MSRFVKALLLALLLQPVVRCEESEESPAEIINRMDTDNDGMLSLAEILNQDDKDDQETENEVTAAFPEADTNNDEKISVEELPESELLEIIEDKEL